MSEYGWEIEYTLSRPLAQCCALYAAATIRHGHDLPGPSYLEREIIRAIHETE